MCEYQHCLLNILLPYCHFEKCCLNNLRNSHNELGTYIISIQKTSKGLYLDDM